MTLEGANVQKYIFSTVVSVLLSALTLVLFEGAYSLYNWHKPHRPVIYQLAAKAGLVKPRSAEAAYAPYFSNPRELADLLPLINEQNIGVGDTPYTPGNSNMPIIATRQTDANGCLNMKPNQHIDTFFLHSSAFGPYAFPTVFYPVDKKIDPRLEEFFRLYGGPHKTFSTNGEGERITVPDVAADRIVLISGDSVAFGANVDDDATIASQLQARDSTRRYVNVGVPAATAMQIHCRLEEATQRYHGKIDELIYVFCENDLDDDGSYRSPQEAIEALKSIVAREKIRKVTVIFAPYFYMVVPEMTRIDDFEFAPSARREKLRANLKGAVEAAGFRWVDSGALARSEEQTTKSSLAILAYYVDTVHLSAYGTRKLVDYLTASP